MFVSMLLQYFVLASFFWMLMEGVLLYKMVILVFETRQIRLPILFGIAYGIPLITVPLTVSIHHRNMIRQEYCWISKENGLIWSVLGPIAIIIMVNFIIFIMTLHAATKLKKIKHKKESREEKRKNLMKRSKGMFTLMILLGFSWIVGFFQVPSKELASYLFVILNGLQGVFLFLTQVILNNHIRHKLLLFYKEHVAKFLTKAQWTAFASKSSKVGPKRSSGDFSDICPTKTEVEEKVHPSAPVLPVTPVVESEFYSIRFGVFLNPETLQNRHPFALNHEVEETIRSDEQGNNYPKLS